MHDEHDCRDKYPERFAQISLGHNSKAWARAYSKKAQVILPPLEDYERKIIPLNAAPSLPVPVEQEQPIHAVIA